MSKSTVQGYAVRDEAGILVRTVTDSQRGAIVNWLVAYAKIFVYSGMVDSTIESLWRRAKSPQHKTHAYPVDAHNY